ncbi:MAG: hypothetical protein IIZ09_11665 [Ruminococcus sp.]|nr:hypothetical protein [Ruminococcus sp.]
MSDIKKSDRRRDISDILGVDDTPLSEEFFEEKLASMEDTVPHTKGRRMKLKKPEENALSAVNADELKKELVFRDPRMQKIFGADDTKLSEDFFEEKIKAMEQAHKSEPQKPKNEYEQWLEDGLKNDKGYGAKVTYEGEVPEEESSYKNSTYESYDKWQAETQEMIRRLKARDAVNKARDDNIHDAMYIGSLMRGGSSAQYAGDTQRFMSMILGLVWYALTAAAVVGMFFAFGIRGNDLLIPAGIGGVLGAVIRYNGKEGYTISEAFQMGATEVGIFAGSILLWIVSLFLPLNFAVIVLASSVFGSIGIYVREKIFMVRPGKEAFLKMVPIIGLCIVTAFISLLIDAFL